MNSDLDLTQIDGVENSYDERPIRICMSCGKSDRAPRDVIALSDGNTVYYHKDCHAMLGCAVCKAELEAIAGGHGPKGLKNEKLWLKIVEEAIVKAPEDRHIVYTSEDIISEVAE